MKKFDLGFVKYIFEEFVANLKFIDTERLNNLKRRELIKNTLSTNMNANLITLLKYGVPPSMRKEIYSSILSVEFKNENINIEDNILLLDYVLYSDIKVNITYPRGRVVQKIIFFSKFLSRRF